MVPTLESMRLTKLLAAVAVAAAALVPTAATAQAATTDMTLDIWHWNIAGHTIHEGKTNTGVLEHAVTSIVNRDAEFVSFNEICWGQYQRLQTLLGAAGWPLSDDFARFATTREPKSTICNGNENFGHALFSKFDLGVSKQYLLPADPAAPRKLLCAPLEATPRMKFCSVHITTGPRNGDPTDYRGPQLDYMLDVLNGFHAAGETYVVAGDFNVQPNYEHLDGFYAPSVNTAANRNNSGAHRELDDTDTRCPGYGEFTATVTPERAPPCGDLTKLDLIMARESQLAGSYTGDSLIAPVDCVVTGTTTEPCSDHRVTIGTVKVRVVDP